MTSRMMAEEEKVYIMLQGFQDLFFTKYFPPNMKEAVESDFMRITQHRSESVSGYEDQFSRLSRQLCRTDRVGSPWHHRNRGVGIEGEGDLKVAVVGGLETMRSELVSGAHGGDAWLFVVARQ
ncbi:hypothetical protein RJ640_014727 [Escallonia rubra]|uniref:Retrotransposon gag domain-containing protein n=1 Tax=Escallonia rubra TaxID=112253 RepID=A0AA88RVR1_9ASTE|nr:hypothetical protein RJ640_014727 [Escallonia rubra]